MTASASRRRHSYAEYLELDETSNVKLEFFDGEIFAMAGGTHEHAELAMNVGIALAAARDLGCHLHSSDLRVRVLATGLAAYPDVTVVCGPKQTDPESRTTVVNPTVIVEVLSDGTQDYDRGEKLEHYRQIPSLQVCMLVSHRERHIEVWQRGQDGEWSPTHYRANAMIELDAIGVSFAVDEVYRGVID
ncbi:MAG: Uma2 family endonuclease [Enhygromyxa sp.]